MCSPASVSFCDLVRSAPPKEHTRIVDRATGSCEQPSGKLAPRCDGFANVGFREAVPDAPALANDRNRVRRETGKEQMVRVHYDEGVATHIGPESCAGGREAVREALTGESAGQPLSHEKVDIPGADAVRYAEGHTKGRAIASSPTTRRGRRPWHVQTLFVREPGGLVVDQGGTPPLARIGKARSRSR